MADVFAPDDVDPEIIKDFLDGLYEAFEDIEQDLLALEHDPADKDAINSLFRAVHSIKGNARMCLFNPISDCVHDIEEALSEMRSGRLPFTPMLGEAVLLSLDQLKVNSQELARIGSFDLSLLNKVRPLFRQIKQAPPKDIDIIANKVIKLVSGEIGADLPFNAPPVAQADTPEEPVSQHDETVSEVINYFKSLSITIDEKCPFWENRSQQQVKVALGINRFLDVPLDEVQLVAAVLLHDIGMVFLPESLINKTQKFNALDERKVKQHVNWGYDWIRRIPGWDIAAGMILQHHERPDGTGYPSGLKSGQIHPGAQIIAIADAFFSITNERSDRTYKKSLMRAITEINSYKDLQFEATLVDAFNKMVREMYIRPAG